ncbi:PepSY-associated TM helix domain-containing protein [Telluria beijingensis]|uniref:PepSY-associated TM helix domain-containing protein n=1 Tax=Telluria beijingensis TaxID=3068633 RepID=UPI002795E7D9|nr:PepSY-associated TM helix domain-containing protein [Massilia sp. REN29]
MAAPNAPGLRQAMAGLHLWAGLLGGWLLIAIFVTGGISYYRDELTQWLRPEIPARPAALDQATAAQRALGTLARQGAGFDEWHVILPGARANAIEVAWERGDTRERALLDPTSGALLAPRATQGGEFFYYFHFSLHYLPATLGRWIVGLCTIMSLVVVVSGIVIHRRIFKDFFTFRPGKGQRSWLDAHNGFSVLSLPFHLMILYTGLVTLMFFYMPWPALAAFGPQQARSEMAKVMQPRFDTPARSGSAAPLASLAPLMAQADARWGSDKVGRIVVTHPGDGAARIAIVRGDGDRVSVAPSWLLFDGVSGALLATHDSASPAIRTWGGAYALHLGRFADPLLRLLYFLSSLAGAAMVATGMVLWAVKRRQKSPRPGFGLLLVERGNVACVAGLSIAVAGFMLANRLLPLDLAARAQWEIHCFFAVWGLAALFAACRPAAQGWRALALASGALWASLPLVNIVTTGRLFPAFDAAFIGMAGLSWLVSRRWRSPSRYPPAYNPGRNAR